MSEFQTYRPRSQTMTRTTSAACTGSAPTTLCACYSAHCSRCGRHRIDTSSIGRHMELVEGALTCADCAAEFRVSAAQLQGAMYSAPTATMPVPCKADYLRGADTMSEAGFHAVAATLRAAAKYAPEQPIALMRWTQVPERFQSYPAFALDSAEWSAHCAAFRQWCAAEGVHYYASPRESFSEREAVAEAVAAGASKLLLEDMS
jgi:hypothetical protein